jgi:hypothetical protein
MIWGIANVGVTSQLEINRRKNMMLRMNQMCVTSDEQKV